MRCLKDTQIKIGHHIVKVRFLENVDNVETRLGSFNMIESKISVKKNIDDALKIETLLHEILHAFVCYSGVFHGIKRSQEEMVCDLMSNHLLNFIKDNKKFFIKIFVEGDVDGQI